MLSIRMNRWTFAAVTLAALAAPAAVLAQTPEHTGDNAAQFPSKTDLKALTTSGSYLAARHASVERDAASAAAFYRSALRTDPKNNELLDRAFISSLADGDIDEAVKLADRILTMDKANRVARLVVGVRDLKQKKYPAAQLNINQSIRGPITDLVATLLSGWASYGAGDAKAAVAGIDKLTGPEWYPIFKDLHTGMILETSGKDKDAGTRFERAYKLDDSMLRVSDAYARWLSRNKDGAAAYFFCLRSRTPTTSRATRFALSIVRMRSASLTASSMSPSASDEIKARSKSSLFLGSVRSAER